MRGYYGIGIYHPKHGVNIGGLWRSAYLQGAAFIFTIGARGKFMASDTPKTHKHIPLFEYQTIEDAIDHGPHGAPWIGVEQGGKPLQSFTHPERAIYLLGAEDHGLPRVVIEKMHYLIEIETAKPQSMNVATAGSIVLYDRLVK